jgi:hypothetical protein
MDDSRSVQSLAALSFSGHLNLAPSSSPSLPQLDSENLMGQLLFASRELAENQFRVESSKRPLDRMCAECRATQPRNSNLEHTPWCRVGHVLRLLAALGELAAGPGKGPAAEVAGAVGNLASLRSASTNGGAQ